LSEDQYSGTNGNGGSDDVTYEEGKVVTQPPTQQVGAPQKVTQKKPTPKATPVKKAPHPANTLLPTSTQAPTQVNSAPESTGPSNPFKEGTKRFLVAQRLIEGEVDRSRLAREVGVSNQTIYNVATDLRQHEYNLMIDVNSEKSTATATTANSPTSTSPVTQQPTRREVSGRSTEEVTSLPTPTVRVENRLP
jgi:hypothetical protein